MGYIDERWGKNKLISRENVKSSILHAPYERNFVDKQKSRENALGSHFDVLLEGKLDHKQKRRENALIRRGGYYAYLNLPSDADGRFRDSRLLNNIHRGRKWKAQNEIVVFLSHPARKIDCLSYAWPPVCLTIEKARVRRRLKSWTCLSKAD